VAVLLDHAGDPGPGTWVGDLQAAAAAFPGLHVHFAQAHVTRHELNQAGEVVVRPALSQREREVLTELARGATYADIAANLFVSENTVKTHISSLYSKLGVGRRSGALAVARKLNLL
jgi:LuxR family transcriptional regulator, maltose regulon positive regulatory protein